MVVGEDDIQFGAFQHLVKDLHRIAADTDEANFAFIDFLAQRRNRFMDDLVQIDKLDVMLPAFHLVKAGEGWKMAGKVNAQKLQQDRVLVTFLLEQAPFTSIMDGFVARLSGFLRALPPGLAVAVELRNPELLTARYVACLRNTGATHVYNRWSHMPDLATQWDATGPAWGTTTARGRSPKRGTPSRHAVTTCSSSLESAG